MTAARIDRKPAFRVIWLSPHCAECYLRCEVLWCQDRGVFDNCPECGAAPIRYQTLRRTTEPTAFRKMAEHVAISTPPAFCDGVTRVIAIENGEPCQIAMQYHCGENSGRRRLYR